LILEGKLVDVAASDAVLDDKPADVDTEELVQVPQPAAPSQASANWPAADGGSAAPSYAQARIVDMTYRAKLRRLEYEKVQGKLIDAEAVRKLIADANRTLRDGLLAIPGRLAPICAAETDQKKIESLMLREIKRELVRQADAIDSI